MPQRVHSAIALIVTVCLSVACGMPPAVDRTIRPGEAGTDVVMATIEQLEQLGVFPDTNRLLRRIAYAETRDGVDIITYRPGYDGGIWQVDELIFLQTQDTDTYPELEPLLLSLLQLTGLDWLLLPWNELRRPFFSGMAASIYLAILPDDIPGPGDIAGQARYWKRFYNSDPINTEQGFVDAVEELESEECTVRGLDLVFVFDSSGSVGEFNFTVEKQFAVNITNAFNIGPIATQVGAVAYSGFTYHILPLNALPSNRAVRDGIMSIPYNDTLVNGRSTNTSGALRTVRESLLTERGGARPSQAAFPRVVIVITDGRSNIDADMTIPSAQALHQDGVIVFTVGIGKMRIRVEELMGVASQPQFATLIGGFNLVELQGVQRVISDEACRAPVALFVEEDVRVSTQLLGTVSYFQYELPDEGMTLRLNVETGRVVLYASSKIPNPNSAFYDVRLETESSEDVFLDPDDFQTGERDGGLARLGRRQSGGEDLDRNATRIMIFVTIEGLKGNNSYILETTFGDTSSKEPGGDLPQCSGPTFLLISLLMTLLLQ